MCAEYDDSDGTEQQHYNDYNSSAQHFSSNKRNYDNSDAPSNGVIDSQDQDPDNDVANASNDGEGSTSTESGPKKKRRKEFLNLNATFMAGVQGVQLVTEKVRQHFHKLKNSILF